MGYFELFSKHPRLLSFGILLTLFSSFGQTFLIAIFVPGILADLGLGTGDFGMLYAAATLLSALSLPFFGRLLDRMPVRSYSMLVGAGLMAACFLMAVATSGLTLFLAVLGLRLTGQGLLGLTAATTMARSFTATRGRALSVSGLGYPLGEGLLPMIVVLLMTTVGWRWSWGVLGGVVAVVLLPLILQLVKGVPESEIDTRIKDEPVPSIRLWTDGRFWLLLPGVLVLPFVLTGLFLYQIPLAAEKGWNPQTMAMAFTGFASARLLFSLATGPWVDRWGAVRLFPFLPVPLVLGIAVLLFPVGVWGAFVFLFLAGVSQGGAGSIMTALWSEVYGLAALGAVKSTVAMVGVLSTAISPILIGWLLQEGVSFRTVTAGCAVFGLFAVGCSALACGRLITRTTAAARP